ncbi:hypothetical protein GCM10027159_18510 [Lysobacter terrae]
MERLYSFPQGRSGIGLILLRVCIAASLGWLNPAQYLDNWMVAAYWLQAGIIFGVFVGFLTPLMAFGALVYVLGFLGGLDIVWPPILLGLAAGALILLGPGGYSVDACLYGWREVKIPGSRPRSRR